MVAAVATIGGALIGAKSSRDASKSAAKGQDKSLQATQQAANTARNEAKNLFGAATKSREKGFGNALEFLGGAPQQQLAPFMAGNNLAQQQVSRGLDQTMNAIMGNPVDLSGFQPRNVGNPSSFNFDLSGYLPKETPKSDTVQFTPYVWGGPKGNGAINPDFIRFNLGGRMP